MVKRPRVGVTGDHRRWAPSWWCLSLVLRLLGARPRRISVVDPATDDEFDALIISGGNDIGPELYNGEDLPKAAIDRPRDELEVHWIRRALKERIPLLGICRGAQLLNVVLGGSLIQDVRPLRFHTSNRASLLPSKRVRLRKDTLLRGLLGKRNVRVNSLHHQAIDTAGDCLEVVARDRDDLCQAVECIESERTIVGVQWHPEYLFYLPSQLQIFRWLLTQASAAER